jgi:hypothetical protein
MVFAQVLLKRLAAIAMGLSLTSAPDVASALEEIPTGTLDEVMDGIDDLDGNDRLPLIGLLSVDRRFQIRVKVARSIASAPLPWNDTLDQMIRRMAGDPWPRVRREAARALGACLSRTTPLERTQILAQWSLAPEREVRLALARSLSAPFEAVGRGTALAVLLSDPSPAVRRAARQAGR